MGSQHGSETPTAHAAPTFLHQATAAAGASVVSATVTNPFDVVKTRMQSRPPTDPALAHLSYTKGIRDAIRRIARDEGVKALWRGTGLSLTMAIPMVGIYMPLYDYILGRINAHLRNENDTAVRPLTPLLAGISARSVAVYCTSPMELMRTRLQGGSLVSSATNPMLGLQMWRGVGATLWRDVPFSGLYWAFVEPIRGRLLPEGGARTELEVFRANAVAGAAAGAMAAAVTTPFDVAKTRMQLYHVAEGGVTTFGVLGGLLREKGLGCLYKGWTARSLKGAIACSMVLSSYEMLKFFEF